MPQKQSLDDVVAGFEKTISTKVKQEASKRVVTILEQQLAAQVEVKDLTVWQLRSLYSQTGGRLTVKYARSA